jgi:hypothetical protein
MAIDKKMTQRIIVLFVFVVILVSGLYIYNVKLVSDEEAKIADIRIPLETRTIKSSLDVIENSKLRWKDAVTIQGWVAKVNVTKENRALYLVLKSKTNTFIYQVEDNSIKRPDVTKALDLNPAINNHGFALTFPLKPVKGDSYKMGFVIEDETGSYYASINKVLTIPADGDSAITVKAGSEPTTIAQQVTLSVNEPNRGVEYFFDKINQSEDYVTVSGWGYLKGLDATSKSTYLLLKKDKNVSIFNVGLRIRKDVTKAFSKENLNLDSSGFVSSIPAENLEKGQYQLGLYIVQGNQTGVVYSKKVIDIGK